MESWSLLPQEVLVEELVAAVDSLQRYAVSQGVWAVLESVPAALSRSAIQALGPWRPLLLPLPTPLELLSRCCCCCCFAQSLLCSYRAVCAGRLPIQISARCILGR